MRGTSLMLMLCASRPTWMWKTQISVTAKSTASTHHGICRPSGGSGGKACRPTQRTVPRTASTAVRARTRPVGRTARRTGAGAPGFDASSPCLLHRRDRAASLSPVDAAGRDQLRPRSPRGRHPCPSCSSWSPRRFRSSIPLWSWSSSSWSSRSPPARARPEVVRPVGISPGRSGPGRPGPGRTRPVRVGPGRPGPRRPGPGRPGPLRPRPGRPGPLGPGPGRAQQRQSPVHCPPAQVAPAVPATSAAASAPVSVGCAEDVLLAGQRDAVLLDLLGAAGLVQRAAAGVHPGARPPRGSTCRRRRRGPATPAPSASTPCLGHVVGRAAQDVLDLVRASARAAARAAARRRRRRPRRPARCRCP